jgi:23S rRNA (cytosine1962-C5)-methyltransferase
VYGGAIARVEGEPQDGDVVDLCSHGGDFLARGLYNSRSNIRVRLYCWSPDVELGPDFFRQRLVTAIHLRETILRLIGPRRACRLVFSEGDGLSGCTVDRYDRWLVLQFTSLGLALRRDMLADLLEELVRPAGIYLRTERGIGQMEGLELQDGLLRGNVPHEPIVIDENGLQFLVHLREGQKTGFYLDQRDNRHIVARFAARRRVLDAFCYTGAFGLHAARAGASDVCGVDISEPALALARANARCNQLENISFVRSDVFEHLASLERANQRFGLVVLDPPRFARRQEAVEDALRGYKRLQTLALRVLEPNGILVTCCCSGLISVNMLEDLLARLAVDAHRDIQILECRGQAPDHPIAVVCPESNYLKCLVTRVR